jgi:diguanylate cyclase (GGDEF)-like protein/PAS domain S-box-containing protein
VLAAVAVGVGAWSEALAPRAPSLGWVAVAGLLVALIFASWTTVEFRHGPDDDVDALDLFEAALAPALLLLPGARVVALIAVAKLVAELALMRVRPVKAAFNVAAWSAAAAVGSLVVVALPVERPLEGRALLGLAVAMVAVTVVNQVAYVAVLRLAERRTLAEVIDEIRPAIVPAWLVGGAVTLCFGLLFAAACSAAPVVAWLLPVPLAALHWASQGYVAGRADLARAEALHHATRTLATSPEPRTAIPAFLEEVRAAFAADAVDLVSAEDDGLVVIRARTGHEPAPGIAGAEGTPTPDVDRVLAEALLRLQGPARMTTLSADPVISEELARHGWRDCLVAHVPRAGGTRGALCVHDPRGVVRFDRAELAVVEGLAGEVAGALGRADTQAALRASEARFRGLVQHSSDMVVVLDAEGVVQDVLPSATTPPMHLRAGRPIIAAAHPEDVATITSRLDRLVASPGSADAMTWRAADEEGSWRNLETVATNLLDDPAVGGVVLNSRDITERERAAALVTGQAEVLGTISRRAPLEETVRALAAAVAAQTPGAGFTVVLLDGEGATTRTLGAPLPVGLVPAVTAALAPEPEAQGGRRYLVVDDVEADERWSSLLGASAVRALWAAPIDRSDGGGRLGLVVLHFDGPRVPDEPDVRVLESSADLALIAVEAVAAQEQLVHQATHDALTGLPNRLLFLDRTSVALSRLNRSSLSVAVLFLDLDRFKTVNDSLGHDVGDRLLVALARRLEQVMRPADTVARFGGDEFTILCEDIDGQEEAAAIATRVREVVAEPVSLEGHDLWVTASIGIASTADPGRAASELVEDADAAMYRAKRAGGDVHRVHDTAARSRALLELVTFQALRKAIERDELLLHYQPTVDLTTGHVVGAEALVRWDHPEHGLVQPLEFISLAESTGLIVPLGTIVLNEACAQTTRWAARAGEGFLMSVNLSARQFADPNLPDLVAGALRRFDTPPSSLSLEITESTLMEHAEGTLVALHALKALGVRLAIDDFGTGYSSLTYLKRFPIDVIKVDKSFVDGLGRDAGDEAIVATVVELAHTLGMQAVAEGVETDVQLRWLRQLHCDVAQGYLFSRPVPAGDIVFSDPDVVDLRQVAGQP